MSADRVRVLVADDHAIVREGIRSVLSGTSDLEVVAEAADGAEALALAEQSDPDVVVLDVSMPGKSGLEVTAMLRRTVSTARVLILSMHDHPEYVLQAVRSGAHGYVLKDTAPADLREAVRAVHRGEAYFCPTVAKQLSVALRGELEREQRRGTLEALTGRERDVLVRIAQGRTNKEIAAELGISPRTVETHRESLMRKLRIRTVAGLTRFALEGGVLAE
ncbi:MAG: response regulator [Gemmatimonadales bacterium]|nr:response regulator [Gemmatimonadales bacterium]NIN12503.1 response regulator [Gemmatimonadales bacterium]NIN50874.1 response regulator [Gemmatimonadales bacterium]NIP08338.1 response regulator [Gemmatimonadales bacterium]NIR03435.1 response regulator [Gemmatimonadales bacterium]